MTGQTSVKDPARLAMEKAPLVMLVTDGMEPFADEMGVERVANDEFDDPVRCE